MFYNQPLSPQQIQRRNAIRGMMLAGLPDDGVGQGAARFGFALHDRLAGNGAMNGQFPPAPPAPSAFPPAPPAPNAFPAAPPAPQGQQPPVGVSPMFQHGFDGRSPGMQPHSSIAPSKPASGLFPQTAQQGGGFDLQGLLSNIFARGGGLY